MNAALTCRFTRLALVGCLAIVAGCGRSGAAINKQTADKIQPGMTEAEVVALLGPATDSREIAVPNIGSLFGGKMPEGSESPIHAKQSFWRDGGRSIAVTFVDGKVAASLFTDAASVADGKQVEPPDSAKYAPPGIPGFSDVPFQQTGNFVAIKDQEGVVNFAIPYALPPNVEIDGYDKGNVVINEVKATGFKWKGVGDMRLGGNLTWTSKGVKATKLPEPEGK